MRDKITADTTMPKITRPVIVGVERRYGRKLF